MKKRTKILSGIFLSGLALGFAAVFIIALLGGIHLLPLYRMEPQDILPADHTVLLLHHPDAMTIGAWGALFPSLAQISSTDADAIAVVRDASGMQDVWLFVRVTSRNDGGCIMGKYRILSAKGTLCPDTLATGTKTLHEERGYKGLGKTPKGSWVFLRRDALSEAPVFYGRIMESSVLSSASHIRIVQEEGDSIITLWPVAPPSHTYDLPDLSVRNAIFSLGTGNLKDAVERVLSGLSIPDRLTARGLLLTRSASLFGPDISLEHHLLPLLQENVTFAVLQTASGSRVFIGGSAGTTSHARNAADALHTAFRLRHPDTAIVERTFDKRFALRTMQVSEERISEESGTIHDWNVRITRDSEDGRLLITALQGRAVRISDSAELVLASLAGEAGIPIPVSRRPIARKTVQAAALPKEWMAHSPLLKTMLSSDTGNMVMVLEQLGETGYVRLQENRE